MNNKLGSGDVCMVTGAAGGMGAALADALVQRGCTVIATDICKPSDYTPISSSELLEYIMLDVTNEEAFSAVVQDVVTRHKKLDCLINNAGVMSSGKFINAKLDEWKRVVDINMMGVVHGSYFAFQAMKESGGGKIINVSSTAGITPVINSSAYAASKHAVSGLTNSLRGEGKEFNIDLTLIIPGMIDTGIFDAAKDDDGMSSKKMSENTPWKKLPPSKAAEIILNGVDKGAPEIAFPLYNKLIVRMYRWFPQFMAKVIMDAQDH